MRYRKLGLTGITVSEIGLGCEGFVDHDGRYTRELVDIAAAGGVNYIDLYSSDPRVREGLGRALAGRNSPFRATSARRGRTDNTGAHATRRRCARASPICCGCWGRIISTSA